MSDQANDDPPSRNPTMEVSQSSTKPIIKRETTDSRGAGGGDSSSVPSSTTAPLANGGDGKAGGADAAYRGIEMIKSATDIDAQAAFNYQTKLKRFIFEVSGANVLNDVSRVAELCDLRTATLRDPEMEKQYCEHRLETSLRRNTVLGVIVFFFDMSSLVVGSASEPWPWAPFAAHAFSVIAFVLAGLLFTNQVPAQHRRLALRIHQRLCFTVYFLLAVIICTFPAVVDSPKVYAYRQPNFFVTQALQTGTAAIFGFQFLAYSPKKVAFVFVLANLAFIAWLTATVRPGNLGLTYWTSMLVFLVIVVKVVFAAVLHRYRAAVSQRLTFHWEKTSPKTVDLSNVTSPKICGMPTYLNASPEFCKAYDESMVHSFYKGANISLLIDVVASLIAYLSADSAIKPSILIRLISLPVILVIFNLLFILLDNRRPPNWLTLVNLLCVTAITLDNLAFIVDALYGVSTFSNYMLFEYRYFSYKAAASGAAIFINMAGLLAAGHRLNWFVGTTIVNMALLIGTMVASVTITSSPEPEFRDVRVAALFSYYGFAVLVLIGLLLDARSIFKAQLKSFYLFQSKK